MASTGAILTQSILCVIAVLVLVAVAKVQTRRKVSEGPSTSALRSFVVWWILIATHYGLQAVFILTQLAWTPSVGVLLVYSLVQMLLVVAAFAFLLDYLVYIVTGRQHWRIGIGVFYVLLIVVSAIATPLSGPFEVQDTPTGGDLVLAEGGSVSIGSQLAIVLAMVPVVFALALKMRLWWAAKDSTRKYRLGMVIVSVLFFLLAVALLGNMPADIYWKAGGLELQVKGGGIVVIGALPIVGAWIGYRAYRPAAWVENRFGIIPQ